MVCDFGRRVYAEEITLNSVSPGLSLQCYSCPDGSSSICEVKQECGQGEDSCLKLTSGGKHSERNTDVTDLLSEIILSMCMLVNAFCNFLVLVLVLIYVLSKWTRCFLHLLVFCLLSYSALSSHCICGITRQQLSAGMKDTQDSTRHITRQPVGYFRRKMSLFCY